MKAALAIVGGLIVIVGVWFVSSFVSAKNYGNSAQVQIHAQYEANENQFAQYGQKVAEAVGVANIAADQMADLLTGSLEARYGGNGAQAQLLAIQEAFPGLDQGVYTQIQRIVEAGRNDFTQAQNRLVDLKRSYQDALGSFPQGMFLDMAGYPSINIGYPLGTQDDYPIISTQRAQNTFETGVECGNALTAANGTDNC